MGFRKKLHIAVIGSPSSGKSYLLYDLIHAFHNLGYVARELPLKFPHSSFGSFFYDVINPMTGGMKGTERYACRPENHFGTKGKISVQTFYVGDTGRSSEETCNS